MDGWRKKRDSGNMLSRGPDHKKTEKWKEQMCFSYSQMKEDDTQTRVPNWIQIQDELYGYM